MPVGVPTDVSVDTFNGTAVIVKWTEVPNIRTVMKGVVQGYQVRPRGYYPTRKRGSSLGAVA